MKWIEINEDDIRLIYNSKENVKPYTSPISADHLLTLPV